MAATPICLFASDLHGRVTRYETLFRAIEVRRPRAVFLGGDLLPAFGHIADTGWSGDDFLLDFLGARLRDVRQRLGQDYPRVFVIFGNDDPRSEEPAMQSLEQSGLLSYIHGRRDTLDDLDVFGYACVPPTPFLCKDWERYDVSRYVPPGSVAPEEGRHSVPVELHVLQHATIQEDLAQLVGTANLARAILVLHSPPAETALDRAALDGKSIDHVPLDLHVGSIAVRRLIETRQPLVTLHGHVHESARLTGRWREQLGRTWMFTAAHDGPELALVSFHPEHLDAAQRELL